MIIGNYHKVLHNNLHVYIKYNTDKYEKIKVKNVSEDHVLKIHPVTCNKRRKLLVLRHSLIELLKRLQNGINLKNLKVILL